jgi:hypothetical protein
MKSVLIENEHFCLYFVLVLLLLDYSVDDNFDKVLEREGATQTLCTPPNID